MRKTDDNGWRGSDRRCSENARGIFEALLHLQLQIIIRNETKSDIEVISEVTKAAFEDHPYSNQTQQFIVSALRAAGALTVSLVAEVGGKV